jgi:hypothetical protein
LVSIRIVVGTSCISIVVRAVALSGRAGVQRAQPFAGARGVLAPLYLLAAPSGKKKEFNNLDIVVGTSCISKFNSGEWKI